MNKEIMSDMIALLAKCAAGGRLKKEAKALFEKMGMEIPRVALKHHLPDEGQYMTQAPELLDEKVASKRFQGDRMVYTLEDGVEVEMYCDMGGYFYVVLSKDGSDDF